MDNAKAKYLFLTVMIVSVCMYYIYNTPLLISSQVGGRVDCYKTFMM